MTGTSKAAFLIATLGGLGRLTAMPGTVASAVAFLPALVMPITPWMVLAVTVLGTWASHRCARDMGRDDPGEIVIDEVAGLWVALALTPQALALPTLFLFRVIDILKPFPVNAAERLPGGVGIMADDVVGGLLTAALLLGLRWLFIQGGLARLIGA
jgi:phosphatidylglycerophosphatase A